MPFPGEVVLDPFAGIGTTGVACAELDRDFVGIEIVPEWAERARARLAWVQQQERLLGMRAARCGDQYPMEVMT